jgi:hypothetical protein
VAVRSRGDDDGDNDVRENDGDAMRRDVTSMMVTTMVTVVVMATLERHPAPRPHSA